jgi:uncharacterized protein YfaS (alpha-2-macroglobulin family)
MKNRNGVKRPSKFRLCLIGALLFVASVEIVLRDVRAAGDESVSATYSRGVLRVTVPYQLPRAGAGRLTVEVLTPEDDVLGHSERNVETTDRNGRWQEEIRLEKPPAVEDLAWHRVRYRFAYSGSQEAALEGIESISQILRMPVVHILAQQSYLSGGAAAVRVVVTDSANDPVAGPGELRIELTPPGQSAQVLFTGRLNRRGSAQAQFRFPAGLVGSYALRYSVDTPIGSAEFSQTVRLEDKVSILLTTEKPIYQPGQTIHARALALDRANHEAAAGRKLTFEVEDSRGNKVLKKVTETDKFGVASAEFALADEVNLGTYHLRALMEDSQTGSKNSGELALNIERYVLPKFKVAVDFGADAKAKRGYRPGEHVTGTVRANYFFGKAVDRSEVTIKATGMDVAAFQAGSAQGKTDADGAYHFDFQLPTYFAGRPLSQGAARVLVEATVKDSAGHSETRGEPITVSESPLILTAVPEGGTLIPGLENQVFILAAYPDGSPARADLVVHAAGSPDRSLATDESGVAEIPLRANAGTETLRIDAKVKEGNHASSDVQLVARNGEDQILLRTDRAVYRAGDRIDLKILSTKQRGTAYVDVIREGQTVLTRDVDLVNGQAELTLTANADLAGALDFDAYLFGSDARPVADHRLAFVQPADELQVEATADAAEYQPGGEARIQFRVTDSKGEGVQAALGLQVVDEAVFALAEKQPGFAKVFFYLEQEVMKPRYEIHSIGMPELVTSAGNAAPRDRAARALFAATELVSANRFETEFGRTVPQTKYAEYARRYGARFHTQMQQLSDAINRAYPEIRAASDLSGITAKMAASGSPGMRDAWGTALRVQYAAWGGANRYYTVTSAGPDKRFGTGDDLMSWLQVMDRPEVQAANPSNPHPAAIGLNIEHDRGPVNGLAEIVGTVVDSSNAAAPGASIEARYASTGANRVTVTDAEGRFVLSSLPAGGYTVRIMATGFTTASRSLTVKARDLAILTVTMGLGAITEQISVTAAATPVQTASSQNARLIAGDQVVDLTLKGRDLFATLATVPGVSFGAAYLSGGGPALSTMAINGSGSPASAAPAPHVRSYFPEALYINPEIVTDGNGLASITIPLADSITTWRMAMMATTPRGALGSGASSIKVFQDFFVEPDLPATLTQGDQVSIPVAVYNYSGAKGDVNLQLQTDEWFSLAGDVPTKNLSVDSGRVGAAQFTIEAKRIGKFKLTLNARMNGAANRADIVVREIEVIPNGREQSVVFNGRLENAVQRQVDFPASSIADASKIFVRLYPGPLSQVIEGMDSILRMPNGCFEQTSSATYPNVLALDYMKRTGKLTPEVHAKAEGFISNGYQRLLTFEVPGGGFSWFGQAPANKILTGYGLMEFYDMSQVYDVDAKVIQRTQQWLAGQQQADGSWRPDTNFINEGATNRFNTGDLRITAYLSWSLENTGYQGPAVEKAKRFVEQHMNDRPDAYTLAVLANFAADYGKDRGFTNQAMQLLLDARTEKDDEAWWTAEETSVYGRGASAAVETTGLAVQALLKWGQASATAAKALHYIAAKKDANGTWGTTQATIMALRALLLSTGKGAADVRGTVEISLNGKPVQTLSLTAENNDLLHQFVLPVANAKGANAVGIRFDGSGGLAYQVVGRYFVPWSERPANEALSIGVTYDRTRLAQDDIAKATATVRNNLATTADMVMIDLGVPPGFDLLSEDLQDYREKSAGRKSGCLEKFSMTATQAILYFNSIAPGETVQLSFRLRAKYPIRAQTFPSRAYEYYDPDVNSVARPVRLEVAKK